MKEDEFKIEEKTVEQIPTKETTQMAQEAKLVLVTEGDAPNVELGIDAIKTVVKAVKEINEARAIVMADSKVTVGDFTGHPIEVIWEPAKAIWDVIKQKDLLLAQVVRIDTSECEELIKEIATEFNTLPAKVVLQISNAISAAWHIGEIFKA
jgi:hypothetical protein